MDAKQIESDILAFVRRSYPEMQVCVWPWARDPSKANVYFTEPKFASLYPAQRHHYLCNLIPADYRENQLAGCHWYELAPGEKLEDLRYADDEFIAEITPNEMERLAAAEFFEALDDAFCPMDPDASRAVCYGDFRTSRALLLARGFTEEDALTEEDELFDIFHVLMAQGGYCDCEVLFNVARKSRLAAEYWRARAAGLRPRDPHSA